jgi:hypothetical protein
MMSQGVGVWYKCLIIMNMAAEVHKVCSKFIKEGSKTFVGLVNQSKCISGRDWHG